MIHSMTGFGRGISQEGGRKFLVEIKTVNHRYSDVSIKIPRQVAFVEDRVREQINRSISRGKVDVYISYEDFSETSKNVMMDEPLAKTYIKAVELLRDRFGLNDDITVSLISRFPDILRVEKNEEDEERTWLLLKAAVDNALEALLEMRRNEGKKLQADLFEKADYIETLLKDISVHAPDVVKEYKQKLENRIRELIGQQVVDDARIVMEAAVFADRCNIDEEITRLGSHICQLRETLTIQQPVGRKLDFLVQEMNREINTIGSKANDLAIIKNILEIKSEIEKIREQLQNIE